MIQTVWDFLKLCRRLLRRQPPIMVALDDPPYLDGFRSIAGWAMSRRGKILKVEAVVDGKIVASAPPQEHRPDVVRYFPHFRYRGAIGFRLWPHLLPDGRYPLCIRVYDSLGKVAEYNAPLMVKALFSGMNEKRGLLERVDYEYQYWMHHQENVESTDDRHPGRALISLALAVHRSSLSRLRETIASVRSQSYENWELNVTVPESEVSEFGPHLEALAAEDSRIRWRMTAASGGIVPVLNAALGMATGEYVAILDHGDILARHAVGELVRAVTVRDCAEAPDILYTDEDRIDSHGFRVQPFLKPDWSPDLLRSMMYWGHLTAYRREFLEETGGLRTKFEGLHEWELALRAVHGQVTPPRIAHIPKVLYHRRLGETENASLGHSEGEVALKARSWHTSNSFDLALAQRAIEENVRSNAEIRLERNDSVPGAFQVRYLSPQEPLVSILIPTRDNVRLLERCIHSIREKTEYPNYEILILDNGSRRRQTKRFLRTCGERVLPMKMPFNHSRLNNEGARRARGSLLLLLNDDTEVIHRDWLTPLVEHGQRPEVGAVGAMIYYLDGRLQHAGIVLGIGPVATTLHSGLVRGERDSELIHVDRNVTAVMGSCFMIRKEVYFQVGGLDENYLPASYNEVDLCLRLRKWGYEIVHTPRCRIYHVGSATRPLNGEEEFHRRMRERWGDLLRTDPYWNLNRYRGSEEYSDLAFHWPILFPGLGKHAVDDGKSSTERRSCVGVAS